MTRPHPPYPVPRGFVWQVVPDEQWRVMPAGVDKRCRWGAGYRSPACGQPAVAQINRGRPFVPSRSPVWWAYCELHLYSRWIERGVVLTWRLRPKEGPS